MHVWLELRQSCICNHDASCTVDSYNNMSPAIPLRLLTTTVLLDAFTRGTAWTHEYILVCFDVVMCNDAAMPRHIVACLVDACLSEITYDTWEMTEWATDALFTSTVLQMR